MGFVESFIQSLNNCLICLSPSIRSKTIVVLYVLVPIVLISAIITALIFISYGLGLGIFTIFDWNNSPCHPTDHDISCKMSGTLFGFLLLVLVVILIAFISCMLRTSLLCFKDLSDYARNLEENMNNYNTVPLTLDARQTI